MSTVSVQLNFNITDDGGSNFDELRKFIIQCRDLSVVTYTDKNEMKHVFPCHDFHYTLNGTT